MQFGDGLPHKGDPCAAVKLLYFRRAMIQDSGEFRSVICTIPLIISTDVCCHWRKKAQSWFYQNSQTLQLLHEFTSTRSIGFSFPHYSRFTLPKHVARISVILPFDEELYTGRTAWSFMTVIPKLTCTIQEGSHQVLYRFQAFSTAPYVAVNDSILSTHIVLTRRMHLQWIPDSYVG